MTKTEFTTLVRFTACDGPDSNLIQREQLSNRPGNVFDGVNTVFQLNNINVGNLTIYDENNQVVSTSNYTLTSGTGRIVLNSAPVDPSSFCDYSYQLLNDAELDSAITMAAAAAGFDVNAVGGESADFCVMYTMAYVYKAIASRSARFYTVAASGKQISKGEIFNHYSNLANSALKDANELRTDSKRDRGLRDVPADGHSFSNWAIPYTQDSSE